MTEVWKSVVGYEGFYEVSSLGAVRSLARVVDRGKVQQHRRAALRRQNTNACGYKVVTLAVDKDRKTFLVSRLVASAFLDNPNGLPEVNHKNGIREDNRVENLEWATHTDNMRHSVSILKNHGERRVQAKLKDADIPVIRQLITDGRRLRDIGVLFGVKKSTISNISNGSTWRHVA